MEDWKEDLRKAVQFDSGSPYAHQAHLTEQLVESLLEAKEKEVEKRVLRWVLETLGSKVEDGVITGMADCDGITTVISRYIELNIKEDK